MPSSCRPARRRILSLQLPAEFVIVFEPVTHAAQFIERQGRADRASGRTWRSSTHNVRAPDRHHGAAPGPLRLSLENRTGARVLPAVWIAGDDACTS